MALMFSAALSIVAAIAWLVAGRPRLLGAAVLLLVMMAAGLYAVVSYATTLRTTEIGVRLALGATPARLVLESVMASMRVVVAGAVLGWLIVFVALTAMMPDLLGDLVSFVGVPVLLLLVAGVACWLPSRRCATVDPLVSLRSQ